VDRVDLDRQGGGELPQFKTNIFMFVPPYLIIFPDSS
jgi:hypothetical protein